MFKRSFYFRLPIADFESRIADRKSKNIVLDDG